MPTVPYNPRPTVQPSAEGTPFLRGTGATPEAFGAAQAEAEYRGAGEVGRARLAEAEATSRIGGAIESIGDTFAKHAMRMQTELNTSAAKDAFLAADVKLGELEAWHRTLEGRAAMDALPEYFNKARAIRDDAKNNLPNQEAQRFFDQDFARRLGFSLVDAGRYSATQFKRYQNGQDTSIIGLATQNAAANYGDDDQFEANLATIRKASRSKADREGLSPEAAELSEKTAVGNAWRLRLAQMAIYDPERAKALFESNKDKIEDAINPAQLIDIQRHIKAGMDNLGARRASQKIFDKYKDEEGPGAFGRMMDDAETEAAKVAPDDPQFLDNLRSRLTSLYNNKKKQEDDDLRFREGKVNDALLGTKEFPPPTSLDELRRQNPEAADYYETLPAKRKSAILKTLANNAKDDPQMTEARFRRFQELKGVAANEPDKFLSMDIMSEDLPRSARGQLMLMQRSITQTVDKTQLTRAMASVSSMLNEANISRARDPKGFDEFTGSFLDAIKTYQEENKKRPGDKELREIAAKLLRFEDPEALFFKGERLFQTEVPDEDRARIIGAYERATGRRPDDDQIRRAYIMKLYRERK